MAETATKPVEVPAPVKALLPVFVDQVKAANGIALQIKGATQGQDEKVNAILATSEDEKISAWREQDAKVRAQIADAQRRLDENKAAIAEHARTLVDTTESINVDEATKEFLAQRQDITAMRKVILSLLGKDEDRLKAILADAGVEEIVNLRKGTGGATVGKPKPRLASATIGDKTLEKPTFTTLAKEIGVDIDVLKETAFKAAKNVGGTDEVPLPVGTTVSFEVVNNKKETVQVSVTARSDAKSAETTNTETASE